MTWQSGYCICCAPRLSDGNTALTLVGIFCQFLRWGLPFWHHHLPHDSKGVMAAFGWSCSIRFVCRDYQLRRLVRLGIAAVCLAYQVLLFLSSGTRRVLHGTYLCSLCFSLPQNDAMCRCAKQILMPSTGRASWYLCCSQPVRCDWCTYRTPCTTDASNAVGALRQQSR